jgi:hypothetical protein
MHSHAAERQACCGVGDSAGRHRLPGGLAAAVGPGDDLQQVTVGVFEVQSVAAVLVVDHPRPGLAGIGQVPNVFT